MRAPDQGLWRHAQARQRELPHDREARDPAGAAKAGLPLRDGIDAIASARTAALVDPEGERLARCLAEIERQTTFAIAAE